MAYWRKPSMNNDHSMARAEERGSRLGEMVRRVPEEVVDIFFGRYPLTLAERVELTRAIKLRNAQSAELMIRGLIIRSEMARLQASEQEHNQRQQVMISRHIEVQKPAAETTQVVPEIIAAKQVIQEEERETSTEQVPETAADQLGKGDQEKRETSQVPDQIVVTDGENKVQEKAPAPQERDTTKVEETAAKEDHTETTEITAEKVIEEEKKNEVPETTTDHQEEPELAAMLNQMSREERIEWDKKMIIANLLSKVVMEPSNKSSYPFLNR